MENNRSRVKHLVVSGFEFLLILKGMERVGGTFYPENLPEDIELVSVDVGLDGAIELVVSSETFPEVPWGMELE